MSTSIRHTVNCFVRSDTFTMWKVLLAVVVGLTLMTPNHATASISIAESGPVSDVNLLFEGEVQFPDFNNFRGQATIMEKTINGLGPVELVVAYESGDIDFPNGNGGFRWGERITNNTGVAWTDFHIDLGGTNGQEFVFQAGTPGAVPDFVVSMSDFGAPPVVVDLLDISTNTLNGGVRTMTGVDGSEIVLSADQSSLWLFFADVLQPGESFDVWIPLSVSNATEGTFTLTQHASFVPEPTTLVIWSLLGTVGVAYSSRRRNQIAA